MVRIPNRASSAIRLTFVIVRPEIIAVHDF
jgi:hypothetical protein